MVGPGPFNGINHRIVRTAGELADQKVIRRLLRKTSNVFLFNSESGRVDRGDLKDSKIEDYQHPEMAIWPPKPEVLISLKL